MLYILNLYNFVSIISHKNSFLKKDKSILCDLHINLNEFVLIAFWKLYKIIRLKKMEIKM